MMLQPADIRREWPRIKADVIAACGSFPYEEVYAACRNQKAALYTCPEGFVVLETYISEPDGRVELNVLLASGVSDHNLLVLYSPEIEEIARQSGADRVVFRRLKDAARAVHGWRMRACEYVKELDDGR